MVEEVSMERKCSKRKNSWCRIKHLQKVWEHSKDRQKRQSRYSSTKLQVLHRVCEESQRRTCCSSTVHRWQDYKHCYRVLIPV